MNIPGAEKAMGHRDQNRTNKNRCMPNCTKNVGNEREWFGNEAKN